MLPSRDARDSSRGIENRFPGKILRKKFTQQKVRKSTGIARSSEEEQYPKNIITSGLNVGDSVFTTIIGRVHVLKSFLPQPTTGVKDLIVVAFPASAGGTEHIAVSHSSVTHHASVSTNVFSDVKPEHGCGYTLLNVVLPRTTGRLLEMVMAGDMAQP